MEIERKFLVDSKKFKKALEEEKGRLLFSVEDMKQGYIALGIPSARVRYSKVTTHIGNGEFLTHTESTFTIKGASTVKSGALYGTSSRRPSMISRQRNCLRVRRRY